jgi:CRP/FNR family transcriptional regulator
MAHSGVLPQPRPRQIEFKKSGIIYSAGFPADAVFAVSSGSVSLTLVDPMGKARIVRFVRSGELFGLDSLLPSGTRVFSAMAREQSRLCFVARTAFYDSMRDDRDRMWQLLLVLNNLLHDDDLQKMWMSGQPVRKRLQTAISRFRNTTDTAPLGDNVVMPIKQWELAQFLGISAETASRGMKAIRAGRTSPHSLRV